MQINREKVKQGDYGEVVIVPTGHSGGIPHGMLGEYRADAGRFAVVEIDGKKVKVVRSSLYLAEIPDVENAQDGFHVDEIL